MKAIALVSLGLFAVVVPATAWAQSRHSDTGTVSTSLRVPFAEIHVDLLGDVVLHSWDQPRAEVHVVDEVTGRVIGYSNANTRSEYAVQITMLDRRIRIAPAARASSFTIGFSTITEHLRHDVYLPSTARICVENNKNDLIVDGSFAALDIMGSGSHALKVRNSGSPGSPIADCGSPDGGGR
jgi:hypothetical protein